jgi:hypothetical protein
MLSPASNAHIYSEVLKLIDLPDFQISLTIPDVTFPSTPEHAPVMIRVVIKVAKFCATAWGTMKIIRTAWMACSLV